MEQFENVRQKILLANTEPDVTVALDTFFAAMLPSETLALPEGTQELLRSEPELVPESAVALKKQELMFQGEGEVRDYLRALVMLYEAASHRIGALRARRLQP